MTQYTIDDLLYLMARLRDPESGVEVETEAQQVRADYLGKLGAHQARLSAALGARAASYMVKSTTTPAIDILRELFGRA